jgi:hypothetical protein
MLFSGKPKASADGTSRRREILSAAAFGSPLNGLPVLG